MQCGITGEYLKTLVQKLKQSTSLQVSTSNIPTYMISHCHTWSTETAKLKLLAQASYRSPYILQITA